MGTVRLLPLVAFAALCLLGLKTAGLIFSGGHVLTGSAPLSAQESQDAGGAADTGTDAKTDDSASKDAQDASAKQANAQDESNTAPPYPTREAEPAKPKMTKSAGAEDKSQEKAKEEESGQEMTVDNSLPAQTGIRSLAEERIQNSLVKRRQRLDDKAKELSLKENLLKAAEEQIAERLVQLKAIEERLTKSFKKRKAENEEQLLRLVKMYSEMKPKAAATIFNRLDINILKELVGHMNTRKMAPILAAMNPARAELLTLEIANRSKEMGPDLSDLPKVSGVEQSQ